MILIKHVLSSIPIHICLFFMFPKLLLTGYRELWQIFFGGGSDDKKKRHWLSWDCITSTFEEGGLGIRKIKDVTLALGTKLAWRLKTTKSLWAMFMNAKKDLWLC